MDISTIITFVLAGILLISVLMMKNRVNDVEDRVDILEQDTKKAAEATVQELQAVRHENSRLRRALKQYNDDEDVFPARQHDKAVKLIKRGGTTYDDILNTRETGETKQN